MQRSHRRRCTLPAAAPKFDFNSPNSAMGDGDSISISISIWRDSARFPRLAPRLAPIGCDAARVFGCLAPRLARAFPPCESRYRRAQLASIGQLSVALGRVRFASGGCSLLFPSRSPPPPPPPSPLLPLLRHPLLPAAIHPSTIPSRAPAPKACPHPLVDRVHPHPPSCRATLLRPYRSPSPRLSPHHKNPNPPPHPLAPRCSPGRTRNLHRQTSSPAAPNLGSRRGCCG